MTSGLLYRTAALVPVLVAGVLRATPAVAQAWTPRAGTGDVSIFVQRIDNTGHLLNDGSLLPDGKSVDVSAAIDVDYGLSDRLALSATLPTVFARYKGPGETPFEYLDPDRCLCWHGGVQDLSIGARYAAVQVGNRFVFTPSVAAVVPSHAYAYRGEAVIGRRLRELQVGADVSLRLDRLSPRLAIGGRYSYAIVQRVLDIPNNRSNGAVSIGWTLSTRLSVRGVLSWQYTHGGLRMPAEIEPFEERRREHDRLLRDNSFHVGVGGAFRLSSSITLFASYVGFVSGTNSHAGHAVSGGINLPFEIH